MSYSVFRNGQHAVAKLSNLTARMGKMKFFEISILIVKKNENYQKFMFTLLAYAGTTYKTS